jgi:very-short-patch-repair endonuclease
MSPAEARMWSMLRAEPFKPFHFRRQLQIGPYYADFASITAKLVIEVDGGQHYEDEAVAYDERRTRVIEKEGYRVLRFTTIDVLRQMEGVSVAVMDALGLQV